MGSSIGLSEHKNEKWYIELKPEEKYLLDLIIKYHEYFSSQDRRYRTIVRTIKVVILFIAMASTIVLGLKTVIEINLQVVIGLILSSLITFITAVASYFNYEEYWMRNITIHIGLNLLRDNFMFDAQAKKLDCDRIDYYKQELDKIQNNNIRYWEKAIKKI